MPRLSQFHFHIRSILKNACHISIEQIRQSFVNEEEERRFDCVLDHFKNNYSQCQIYSLPFIGNRLQFVSNRFPLFEVKNRFSNVTHLLLFDDVQPFESHFFERIARTLFQLKILEIINQIQQHEKENVSKLNINFPHLVVLLLYDIHLDYAQQFLCRIHLPSLNELAIDKDILFTIITQNDEQARQNCSKVARIHTSKPLNQSINFIRDFFPLASYVQHINEMK